MLGSCVRVSSLIAIFALVVGCASVPGSESILITEREQVINITIPISKLAIDVPKGRFQFVPVPGALRYAIEPSFFQFEDQARGVRLAGWFEPAARFQGVKDDAQVAHQNVELKKVGKWDVVSYEWTPRQFALAHHSAHLVEGGSWIVLHLSYLSAAPKRSLAEQHALLDEIILSIQISEKK